MGEYICVDTCFWHNTLVREGTRVLAEFKEMEGNTCFTKVVTEIEKPQKVAKKAVKAEKVVEPTKPVEAEKTVEKQIIKEEVAE